jgi:hypothetical protein
MNPGYAQGQYESIVALVAETLHDPFCRSLGILEGGKGSHEIRANAVGGEDQQIARGHWKHRGLQLRQVAADHTASQEKRLLGGGLFVGAHQNRLYISHAEPGHQAVLYVNGTKTQDDSARRPQFLVARGHQRNDWFSNASSQDGNRSPGGAGGFCAVPDSIDGRDQNSAFVATDQMLVAGFGLSR